MKKPCRIRLEVVMVEAEVSHCFHHHLNKLLHYAADVYCYDDYDVVDADYDAGDCDDDDDDDDDDCADDPYIANFDNVT